MIKSNTELTASGELAAAAQQRGAAPLFGEKSGEGALRPCPAIAPLHDRMPVFLFPDAWETWTTGSFEDILAFQERKLPKDLIEMDHTGEPWNRVSAAQPHSTDLLTRTSFRSETTNRNRVAVPIERGCL